MYFVIGITLVHQLPHNISLTAPQSCDCVRPQRSSLILEPFALWLCKGGGALGFIDVTYFAVKDSNIKR